MVAAGYIDKNQETRSGWSRYDFSNCKISMKSKVSDYRYPSILMQLLTKRFPSTITEEGVNNNIIIRNDQNYQSKYAGIYESTSLFQ